MVFFWILWAFCASILATVLYFFFDSLATTPGGPPAIFFKAAFLVLGLLVTALLGSLWLVSKDYRLLAKLLLAVPDSLGATYLLWLLLLMTWRGRWN